ncbi:MAG: hypothetical protein ACKVOW_06120 [Chitinophagaceae bacterium]
MKPEKKIICFSSVKLLITLLITTILLSGSACKKNQQCVNCVIKREDYKGIIQFYNPGGTLDFTETKIWEAKDPEISEVVDIRLSNAAYITVNERINDLTKEPYQTDVTVLYVNQMVSSSKKFSVDDIKAISRFYKKSKMLHHDFFEVDKNSNFIRNEELSIDVSMITTNAINYISNNLVFDGKTKNALVFIANKDEKDVNSKNPIDILQKKARAYKGKTGSISDSQIMKLVAVEPKCSSPCPVVPGNNCKYVYGSGSGYQCFFSTSCGGSDVSQSLIASNGMSIDTINSTYNSSLHYALRNNILSASQFGQNYIDYYYSLSGVYKDKYTLAIQIETTRVLFDLNSSIQKLNNYASNGNAIFLTTSMKNRISSLINSYKQIYNDNYTEAVFQNILQDMAWAQNKTINQIKTQF